MNTDVNINEIFSKKNQTLFLNKLIMDMDNNADTFKLATKHIVMIEIAKLLSTLKKIYIKYLVAAEDEKLKELLNSTKTSLLGELNTIIDDKYSINKKYVEENNQKDINGGYLKDYHKHIDESEEDFEKTLNLAVKEETEIKLYNLLINLYTSANEDMHLDILDAINVDFTANLINRISAESRHRNMTLKNMSEETYKKYLDLRKSSKNVSKASKIKVKKDN